MKPLHHPGQRGLLWNIFWLLVGNLAAQALAAGMGLLLARGVGPDGYGLYATAFSLAMAFTYTALMGLDSIVPREVAQNPHAAGRVALSALYPALLWFPGLVLLILGAGWALGYPTDVRALLLPAALITALRGLVNLLRSVLRGLERMDLDAAVQTIENGLALFGVGVVLLLSPSVLGAAVAILTAEVLALLLSGFWTGRLTRPRGGEFRLAKEMVLAALPIGLTFTLIGLNLRLDILLLSLFRPAGEVGFYSAAVSLMMLARSVSLMAAAFLPRLSALDRRDEEAFARLRDQGLQWILVPGLAIGVAMGLLSPFLMGFLYGAPFLPAAPALRILGGASIAMFLNTYFWQVLIARGEQGTIARITAGSLVLSSGIALALIPQWGALGAAIAALGRETMQAVLLGWSVLVRPPGTIRRRTWAAFLGAAAAMALFLWPVRETTGPSALACGALGLSAYFVVLAWGGVIPIDGLRQMWRSLRYWLRKLGGWAAAAWVVAALALMPGPTRAQAGIPVFGVAQSDLNGDGQPDMTVVECAFASPRDRILIVDRAGDMGTGSDVLAVADFRDDVWIFDVGADGTAQLILMFSQDGDRRIADLYDDRDDDGQVSYRARYRAVEVTESPHWHVRAIARSDWLLPDGRVNPSLVFHIDGYILRYLEWGEAAPAPGWARRGATTDGGVDWELEVVDANGDGVADYQLQRILALSPPDANIFRSTLYVNRRPRQPEPYLEALFWPLLVGRHNYEAYNYFDRPPAIAVDWARAQIDRVGILGYPIEQGYQINSWARWKKGEVNYANFENPMAYYDLAGDADGRPELMVRFEVFAAGDSSFSPEVARSGGLSRPFVQADYSWDQNNDGRWDYEVSVAGFHPVTDAVAFPDFAVRTVPYERVPDWVLEQEWAVATFVAAEEGGYWSSEGMWDWNVNRGFRDGKLVEPSGLRDLYLLGLIPEPPLENYADIRRGMRGEYATEGVGRPTLYWSPVDGRLHLRGAQGGVWNVDGRTVVRYADRNRDGYLDQWQVQMPDGAMRQLNVLSGFLLYTGDGEVILKRADVALAAFSVQPPRNRSEWQALQQRLEALPAPVPADDLKGVLARWEGPETRIAGATVRDPQVTHRGFRFILEVGPGARVLSGGVEGFSPPSAPGAYRVAWEAERWSVRPLTPAAPGLVALEVEAGREGEEATVRAVLRNFGLEDIREFPLCARLEGPTGAGPVLTATFSVLPGEGEREVLWGWRPSAAGTWRVSVLADCEGARGGPVLLGETGVSVARRPLLYLYSFLTLPPRARAAVAGLLAVIVLLAGGMMVIWLEFCRTTASSGSTREKHYEQLTRERAELSASPAAGGVRAPGGGVYRRAVPLELDLYR